MSEKKPRPISPPKPATVACLKCGCRFLSSTEYAIGFVQDADRRRRIADDLQPQVAVVQVPPADGGAEAVLMMVAAGGMLALNTKVFATKLFGYGWPVTFNESPWNSRFGLFPIGRGPGPVNWEWKFHPALLALDVIVAMIILFAVSLVSESLIRLRAGHQS